MNSSKFNDIIQKVTNPLSGSIPSIKTYKLSVKKRFEGLTILEFYTKAMPHIAREIWQEKIESGKIKLKNKNVSIDKIVKAGEITQHISELLIEPNVNTNIELIEWNNDFIVVNKPAPLPLHPGGRFDKNSLTEILKIAFPNESFKIVHRIDANTTGLVVIAKNSRTATEIINQFKDQTIQKEYLVLAEGLIEKNDFILNNDISKEITASGGREISDHGKNASTEIKVLRKLPKINQTLLSVVPHSGRTNQIRIHLANMGHPIIGDIGYKDPAYFKNNPLTYTDDCLYLHAWKLAFFHKNKKRSFTAKLPAKFSDYGF